MSADEKRLGAALDALDENRSGTADEGRDLPVDSVGDCTQAAAPGAPKGGTSTDAVGEGWE